MKTAVLLTLSVLSVASAQNAQPMAWPEVLRQARGQTVNFYMWGGSDNINRYVDTVVAPAVKKYGVTLRRVPLTDTVQAVNKVLGEKQAGKNKNGSVDLIWINGENFKTAMQAGLLLKGWAERLPNAKLVDWQNPAIKNDFGFPVEGAESPWGSTQWQYVYDSARVKKGELPHNFGELAGWIKAHPGRFTFTAPPNFSGNRFLRQALFDLSGGQKQFAGKFDEKLWNEKSPLLWTYLEDITPDLWRGGQTFPNDVPQLYQLFANGEIDFAFVQNIAGVAAEVNSGQLPKTARVYLFEPGTVSDHHYVAIPYNSGSRAGAMVVANTLLDPQLQLNKLDGDVWGDGLAIDPAKVGGQFPNEVKAALKVGPYTLDPAVLARHTFGDVDAEYDKRVQDGFKSKILR